MNPSIQFSRITAALAVATGLGIAIFTGTGVASAETSNPGTSPGASGSNYGGYGGGCLNLYGTYQNCNRQGAS